MADRQLDLVVRHAREMATPPRAASDRDLLDRFCRHTDQGAFAELVARHGPMVMGVCRRVLGNVHDAEDAFQATWIVLARKAASVRWSDCIAGWLQAVAHRVASKVRGQASRLPVTPGELPAMPVAVNEDDQTDLLQLVQAELSRLPEKYRSPLVLCYLEGKTNAEAADALGWPAGSISKRLARARELLRRRLAGRGARIPAVALPGLITAPALVPQPLQQATTQAAALVAAGHPLGGAVTAPVAALVEGVLREMSLQKLKHVFFVVLSLAALSIGTGVFGYRALADGKSEPRRIASPEPKPAPVVLSRARTFRSNLLFLVFQLVEGETPRLLGTTGPGTRAVQIPAGIVWYVQPISTTGAMAPIPGGQLGFGGGFGGVIGGGLMPPAGGNLGGQLGQFGNLGGQLGQFGNLGGGARGPAARPMPDLAGPLTGERMKAIVTEMKKQSVPGLAIAGQETSDEALSQLVAVPGLQTLLLAATKVGDEALDKLKGLRSLRILALEGTDVTDDGIRHLASIKTLSRLHLTGSRFTNKALANLRDVKGLSHLRLHRTRTDGVGLEALKGLPYLSTLELCGDYTDRDVKALQGLAGLKTLRLLQTSLTDAGIEHLKALKELQTLSIDGHWDFHGIQPLVGTSSFGVNGVMTSKTEWHIPNQTAVPGGKVEAIAEPRFTGKGLTHLAALPKLTDLHISHKGFKDADLSALDRLTGLTRLTVFAPDVSNKGLGVLKGLKKLQTLDLRGTQMTLAALPTLRGLPQLRLLKTPLIPGDPTSTARLAEWRRYLPRTTVQPIMTQMPGSSLPFDCPLINGTLPPPRR